MGAIIYSREFIGSLFEFSLFDESKSFVLMVRLVIAWIHSPPDLITSLAKKAQLYSSWLVNKGITYATTGGQDRIPLGSFVLPDITLTIVLLSNKQ